MLYEKLQGLVSSGDPNSIRDNATITNTVYCLVLSNWLNSNDRASKLKYRTHRYCTSETNTVQAYITLYYLVTLKYAVQYSTGLSIHDRYEQQTATTEEAFFVDC